MAAEDTLKHFLSTIPTSDLAKVQDIVSSNRGDMQAARSEDARVRLVHEFIQQVHDRLKKK